MSLLIKALESAEKGKQAELKKEGAQAAALDLRLEPLSFVKSDAPPERSSLNFAAQAPVSQASSFSDSASASQVRPQAHIERANSQKVAANVFVANQEAQNSTSVTVLLALGVGGVLTIWLGLHGYQYLSKVNVPEAVMVNPESHTVITTDIAATAEQTLLTIETEADSAQNSVADFSANRAEKLTKPEADPSFGSKAEIKSVVEEPHVAQRIFDENKTTAQKPAHRRSIDSSNTDNAPSSESNAHAFDQGSTLKLMSRTPAAAVDPILLAAYAAYSRGDDAAAQKQYRQVLQADTRNVDALLGMAAIALKQSRHADANGWYQKVLEIEPRNTTALSAVANSQITSVTAGSATTDYAGTESRIKNMLVQQPEAANLHAALGNIYAAQSQWSSAQAAYFNACRYAPASADYAFNLAVSLDQLGKSALALAQYQRALALLNTAGDSGSPSTSHLDKAQLEARIQMLQQ